MPVRPPYGEALRETAVLERLADFAPRVAGTPPLGLDLPGSDIDILCHAPDPADFAERVWRDFGHCEGFALWQWTAAGRPIVAGFRACGWPFEIFGAPEPVAEQVAWRHFGVERRLLALGGDALRETVMALRRRGLKTEPAFAAALGLTGDPYVALLALEGLPDEALIRSWSILNSTE